MDTFMKRLLFLLAVLPCAGTRLLAQQPALFLSNRELAERNALAQREDWAGAQRVALLAEADQFPASYEQRFGLKGPELPPEGGQWLHYYACSETGTQLKFVPPDQNICPDNGKVYKGYPYDHVVYMLRADALGQGALTEAQAYRLTGRLEYANKAAQVLNAYADKYLTYAIHDNEGKETKFGARVYSQTLDESIWLIKIAWTYDLVRGSGVLSPAQKQHIERDLLRASAGTVGRASAPSNPTAAFATSNIQCWINAAVGSVGYTLHDQQLISQALDGPLGFHNQMRHSVIDGFWVEGAWFYQFYALRALTQLAQMATQTGTNLWQEEPNLLKLLESPPQVMFADGTLPPFNDSRIVNVFDEAPLYEVAYAQTHDEALLPLLEHGPRNSREAFLFGATVLPKAPLLQPRSAVFPEAGYAVERAPNSDLTTVLKFGPDGGPHGHFDKLNEVMYADGHILSVDPGTQYYGLAIHREWDKMTVAHNTISVDEVNQNPATGKLLAWQSEPQFTAATASAGDAYPGIALTRTMVTTRDYVLELNTGEAQDGQDHRFAWNYHNNGKQTLDLTTTPYTGFPKTNGYPYLDKVESAASAEAIHSTFTLETQPPEGMYVTVFGAPGSQVFTGVAPGNKIAVLAPFLIVRRSGRSARFLAVFQPFLSGQQRFTAELRGSSVVIVHGPGWTDRIRIGTRVEYQRTRSSGKEQVQHDVTHPS